MVDELTPVERAQLIDRVRFGERYLRDCVDKISGRDMTKKRKLKKGELRTNTAEEAHSPYDVSVPKEKPHDFDESI